MSKILKLSLVAIVIVILGLGATWAWAAPAACSTRGCVTRQTWERQQAAASQFAQATNSQAPTPAEALTTLIRQHLVRYAVVQSPVSLVDAARYREEILNLKETGQLQGALSLSLAEYDERIILPFLQQEALRAQYKVESTDELYAALGRERHIFLFLRNFKWDKSTGKVVAK